MYRGCDFFTGGFGRFGGFGGMGFFMMLIFFVLLYLIITSFIPAGRGGRDRDVMEKLKDLYATGEITEEEYLRRKEVLKRRR